MKTKDPDIHVLDEQKQPACTIHEKWIWLSLQLELKERQKQPYSQKSHPKNDEPQNLAGSAKEELVNY